MKNTVGTLEIPGGTLHWTNTQPDEALPHRPTLVFLHYFGGSSRTWAPVIAELGEMFRCVAVDLRGFGASSLTKEAESPASYSVASMAGDVRALIAHLALGSYVLVGHSMGGKVALRLTAGAGCPAGLQALVLIAPSPPTPEPMSEDERGRLLGAWGVEKEARRTLAKTTAKPLPDALARATVADSLQASPHAWRAWLEVGSKENLSAYPGLIHVPVTLAVGEKDENITRDLLQSEIADRLPDARPEVHLIKGASHLLPQEAPLAVADLIAKAVGESARLM